MPITRFQGLAWPHGMLFSGRKAVTVSVTGETVTDSHCWNSAFCCCAYRQRQMKNKETNWICKLKTRTRPERNTPNQTCTSKTRTTTINTKTKHKTVRCLQTRTHQNSPIMSLSWPSFELSLSLSLLGLEAIAFRLEATASRLVSWRPLYN